MLECHFSKPRRQEIAAMQSEGKSDDQVVQAMVGQFGKQALVAPPAEGFNLLAWIMPFAMIGFGLVCIVWIMRHYMRPRSKPLPDIDPQVLASIEKDLSKLDG
jgi:cytochrome c-type biogenesis protein CcmH